MYLLATIKPCVLMLTGINPIDPDSSIHENVAGDRTPVPQEVLIMSKHIIQPTKRAMEC
jgi:hypothetical protein